MHIPRTSQPTCTTTAAWVCAALVCSLFTATYAHAQDNDRWGILEMGTRGVDPNVAATFVDMLQNELASRNKAVFINIDGVSCRDIPCTVQAGQRNNVQVALYGNISKLGSKVIVTITVVDVPKSGVLSTQRMIVDRIEDLDAVAVRMSTAILGGTNTDETAELGSITKQESKPDQRREGDRALSLRVGGITPLGGGYGGAGAGIVMDLGGWFETRNFAIEPRWGLRFDASNEDGSFFEMPFDVGAYYILGQGDFTPFFGGGMGIRYISETRTERVTVGELIVEESDVEKSDDGWGFGTFARAGALLFRTYSMRLAVSVDYNLTFIELNEKSTAQSMTAGVSVMF